MKWLPYELHTHTLHSDGQHTLLEMAQVAKEIGLSGLALTDHNTMSGLQDMESVMEETGVNIIKGLEWTTFYGHMVALGLNGYPDWRDLGPNDIHKGIERIRDKGALAGVAHPYSLGNPMCTGCHWEYIISDWNDVDYLEVWNGPFPSVQHHNITAFNLWTDLLNEGYRLPATYGRDWHETKEGEIPAATFVQVATDDEAKVNSEIINSVKKGALSVSMGPLLLMSLTQDGTEYSLGDDVSLSQNDDKNIELDLSLNFDVRNRAWSIPEQNFTLKLVGNKGVMKKTTLSEEQNETSCSVHVDGLSWIRAELYGVMNDVSTMIAFTNPIYFN